MLDELKSATAGEAPQQVLLAVQPAHVDRGLAELSEPAPRSTDLVVLDKNAAPIGHPPALVRAWFDGATPADAPKFNGSLASARKSATAYALRAKALNTRRAYVAGVRAWCAWCDAHALPCLPGRAEDVAAFLAAESDCGRKVSTITLRRAAIRYLHYAAGCPVPTDDAQVAETLAGIRREAAEKGQSPSKKVAATLRVLERLIEPIADDLTGLRDRALLLVGFAGAMRRAELAAIEVGHLEDRDGGLQLTLPRSKGDHEQRGVSIALPYGSTHLCPVRALRRWLEAARITEGPVFRRVWRPPNRSSQLGAMRPFAVGTDAIEPRTVARIVQTRAKAAGLDGSRMGGHSAQARRADHRDGARCASDEAQAARAPQELQCPRRLPRARRAVREPCPERNSVGPDHEDEPTRVV